MAPTCENLTDWPVNATLGHQPTQCIQEVNYLKIRWQPSAPSVLGEATHHRNRSSDVSPQGHSRSLGKTPCDRQHMKSSIATKPRYLPVWHCLFMPSVLWRCWLGSRKGIRPVKNWVVGCRCCYLGQGADLHMAQLMPLPLTNSCSSKSRLVLPFWYRLTRVVLDKIHRAIKW